MSLGSFIVAKKTNVENNPDPRTPIAVAWVT